MEGYGRFWVIIEMLREQAHYRLEDKPYIIRSLSNQFKCTLEDTNKFLNDCVEEFDLLKREDNHIYSQSLLKRMIHLDEIREKRRYAGTMSHTKSEDT